VRVSCWFHGKPGIDITGGKILTVPMSSILELTPAQLRQAADLKEKLATVEQELNQLADTLPSGTTRKKTKFSAPGLARIRAAQKERWAKIKKGKPSATKRKQSGMSAANKAKVSARMKAYWAARKKGGK
jgi:hypothetical protein